MEIRQGNENDRDKLEDFFREIDSSFSPKISERKMGISGLVERILTSGEKIVLAIDNGRVVGEIAYRVKDSKIYLNITGILEPYRKGMTLKRLIKGIYDQEKTIGSVSTVALPDNKESKKVLRKLGFECVGRKPYFADPKKEQEIYEASGEKILRYLSKSIRL